MRYMEDPAQNELFDFFEQILSPVAYRKLRAGWQHLFRCAVLKLMPVKELAEHFKVNKGQIKKGQIKDREGQIKDMQIKDMQCICAMYLYLGRGFS